MAISTNNIISKQEVVNYFNTNVVDVAYAGINYHSGAVPTFTSGNANGVQSVPASQLSPATKVALKTTDITGDVLTASNVITALRNIATNCSRIRHTISRSYFDTNGAYAMQQELSGKAIYLVNTPVISGSTVPYYTKTPNITAMTVNSSVASPANLVANKIAEAKSITDFVKSLVDEWKTRYDTTITFNYYCCHSQCHSNCYTRARR